MVRWCKQCGSENIEDDSASGDAVCVDCGTVLEESVVVNKNRFAERAGGSEHTLVDQFVSMESWEQTYAQEKKLLEEIASQLRISQHCIDLAFNFFRMCVSRGHTRGRIRSHVVAALLYITCRIENTPHLLLDFSDVTRVNVFELGRTLNFLTRALHMTLPTIDPCLYILCFAMMLDFGDKQKEVVSLATRLVQRMKMDWLTTGRRLTGLCGAALLLASRFYNFNRTVSDVVDVVHISEVVVRELLDGFARTPSSQLTLEDFATVDLEQSEDSPAFVEAEKKRKDEESVADAIEAELESVGEELEAALEKKCREKFKRGWGRLVDGDLDDAASSQKTRSEPSTSTGLLGPSLESLGILRPSTSASSSGAERSPLKAPAKVQGSPSRKRRLADGDLDLEPGAPKRKKRNQKKKKCRIGRKLRGCRQWKPAAKPRNAERIDRGAGGHRHKNVMGKMIAERRLSKKIDYDVLRQVELATADEKP